MRLHIPGPCLTGTIDEHEACPIRSPGSGVSSLHANPCHAVCSEVRVERDHDQGLAGDTVTRDGLGTNRTNEARNKVRLLLQLVPAFESGLSREQDRRLLGDWSRIEAARGKHACVLRRRGSAPTVKGK